MELFLYVYRAVLRSVTPLSAKGIIINSSITPIAIAITGFIQMAEFGIDINTQVDHSTWKIDVDNTTLIELDMNVYDNIGFFSTFQINILFSLRLSFIIIMHSRLGVNVNVVNKV